MFLFRVCMLLVCIYASRSCMYVSAMWLDGVVHWSCSLGSQCSPFDVVFCYAGALIEIAVRMIRLLRLPSWTFTSTTRMRLLHLSTRLRAPPAPIPWCCRQHWRQAKMGKVWQRKSREITISYDFHVSRCVNAGPGLRIKATVNLIAPTWMANPHHACNV